MIKIAHLVHPVVVPETSDLVVAQPITFRTMQVARDFAADSVAVTLYAAQYADESPGFPADFKRVPDLDRSVGDAHTFEAPRKLAILRDLLDRLHAAADDADYLIYTNVDIALQPFFYTAVNRMIESGHDALVINRRSISDERTDLDDVPLMCAEVGDKHPGWDCFVFRRDAYPTYNLADICIGTRYIGLAMVSNMLGWAHDCRLVTDAHLTFHVGKVKEWMASRFQEYEQHNERQFESILQRLLDSPDGCPNRTAVEQFLYNVAATTRGARVLHRRFGVEAPPPSTPGFIQRILRGAARLRSTRA